MATPFLVQISDCLWFHFWAAHGMTEYRKMEKVAVEDTGGRAIVIRDQLSGNVRIQFSEDDLVWPEPQYSRFVVVANVFDFLDIPNSEHCYYDVYGNADPQDLIAPLGFNVQLRWGSTYLLYRRFCMRCSVCMKLCTLSGSGEHQSCGRGDLCSRVENNVWQDRILMPVCPGELDTCVCANRHPVINIPRESLPRCIECVKPARWPCRPRLRNKSDVNML